MVREPASDQHMNAVHELFLLILYSVYVNWCFWWLRYQSSDAIVQTALSIRIACRRMWELSARAAFSAFFWHAFEHAWAYGSVFTSLHFLRSLKVIP